MEIEPVLNALVELVRAPFSRERSVARSTVRSNERADGCKDEKLSLESIVERTNTLRARTNWSRLQRYARRTNANERPDEIYLLVASAGRSEIVVLKKGEKIAFGSRAKQEEDVSVKSFELDFPGIEISHALIGIDDSGIYLEDRRGEFSPAGTYINDRRVETGETVRTRVSDEIFLGGAGSLAPVKIVMVAKAPLDDLLGRTSYCG